MPQDGSNNYQYPPGTPGVPDQTIESEAYNTFLDDLVSNDLNIARPLHRGGTGATTADQALINLKAEKAGQVVTNYDSHVWLAGSFLSDAGATGAPSAGEGYAGTALVGGGAEYIALEAVNLGTGVRYTRQKIANVWGAWKQDAGSQADADARYVNVSGDTMTGDLKMENANGEPNLRLNGLISNWIIGSKNNLVRWSMKLGDELAEPGSNVGSDFVIQRWNDAGGYLTDAMRITRNGPGYLRLSTANQYNATFTSRGSASGNDFEFGHPNLTGYGSTLGNLYTSGSPFLGFHCGAGSTAATYKTLGLKGAVIQANTDGGIIIGQVPNASADNQSLVAGFYVGAAGQSSVGAYTCTAQVVGGLSASGTCLFGLGFYVTNDSWFWASNGSINCNQLSAASINSASTLSSVGSVSSGLASYHNHSVNIAEKSGWPAVSFYTTAFAGAPLATIAVTPGIMAYTIASVDRFVINATAGTFNFPMAAGGYFNGNGVFYNPSATAYKPGGGSWIDSSDARIKTVEGDYTRGLDDVAQLRPVLFTFKGNETNDPPSDQLIGLEASPDLDREALVAPYKNSQHHMQATSGQKFTGLIAQEVETVFPEMVIQRSGYIDGQPVTDLRDLDTTPLIYALINSIKQLKARIEQLESVA